MKKVKNNITLIALSIIIFLFTFSALTQIFCIFLPANAYAKTVVPPEAHALYKKALKEYNAGNFYMAHANLKFILNNYKMGKNFYSDVYFVSGKVFFKEKNFFLAKPYFQRVIYKNPDYKKIYNVIYYMARCDFNLKNYRRSIRDFEFLLGKSKKGGKLYDRSLIYLTLSYASRGRMKSADKLYNRDHVKNILQKSEFLKKRGNYFKTVYLNYLINYKNNFSAAILTLNKKKIFSPEKKDSCYRAYYTGIIAYREKKYPVARNYFIKSSKYCAGYYYESGLAYYGMALVKQKNTNGIKYIKNGTSKVGYPKIAMRTLKFLTAYYKLLNKPEKELKYIKRTLFDAGSIPEITGKEKIKTEKKGAELLYGIIKKDYKTKNIEKFADAFNSFKSAGFLIPPEYIVPKTYLYLAKIKLKEKNLKAALIYAKKYNNLYFLAYIYFKMKYYKKSLSLLDEINLKSVKNLKLINKITGLKLKLYKKLNFEGDYIDLLKRGLNLLPPKDKIKNLYYLGKREFDKNKIKTAEFYFYRILKNGYAKEKNNTNILYGTYYYLGLINYSYKNYRPSLEYFKKGYRLNASGTHFQYELSQIAYIYMKYLKNKKLALKYYSLLKKNASYATYKNLASTMISAINIKQK